MTTSILEALKERAANSPTHTAYTLLDSTASRRLLTNSELEAAARKIAAWIQRTVESPGPVLLVYPSGLEFVEAFWGCLYSGRIAIPIPPPGKNSSKLATIAADSGAHVILTTQGLLPQLEAAIVSTGLSDLQIIDSGGISEEWQSRWYEPPREETDVAYLQYTSGSTSAPRGVMVSHANLIANLNDIDEAFEHSPGDKVVSWLPHFHDMGLVYGILQPVFSGVPAFLLSPRTFVQRPLQWLEAISHVQATHSGGPNFAYDLCARRISAVQCEGLDLSSWRVAFNGAEPVRQETLMRFAAAFKHCGFREETFYPAYGLAEATLKVTCRTKEDAIGFLVPDRVATTSPPAMLTSCGRPGSRTTVRIVDPQSFVPCKPDEIGEIWVAGAGVALGYWRKLEETSATFHARLQNGEGPFLRTGDLGFIREDALYPAGRIKDLIIIRGANYYPQDVEATAESAHSSIRPSCVAAFSIDHGGGEELVIVAEVNHPSSQEWRGAAAAIRGAVSDKYGISPYSVVLVKPAVLPKTSSGKIQRYLCRASFLDGSLTIVDQLVSASSGDVSAIMDEAQLRAEFIEASQLEKCAALKRYLLAVGAKLAGEDASDLDTNRTLVSLGLDSLRAAEVEAILENVLGAKGLAPLLLSEISIQQLPWKLIAMAEAEAHIPFLPFVSVPLTVSGETCGPASMEQERLYWLHEQAHSAAYNLAATVQLSGPLRADVLQRALTEIVQRHHILRTRFEVRGQELVQIVSSSDPVMILSLDLTAHRQPSQRVAVAIREQRSIPFDLKQGPCYRIVLLRTGPFKHVLLIILHHIVADAFSVTLLFQKLAMLYEAYLKDSPTLLAEPLVQFSQFAQWEQQYLAGPQLNEHTNYWVRLLSERWLLPRTEKRSRLPARAASDSYSLTLSTKTTLALHEFARAQQATLFMVLLTVFAAALKNQVRESKFIIGVPVSGRRLPETRNSIGPFAYPLPFAVDLSSNLAFNKLLELVRKKWLEAYAHQEIPFSQIVRSIKGQGSAAFRFLLTVLPTSECHSAGDLVFSPVMLEPSVLDLDLYAAIAESNDQLAVSFAYNPDWQQAEGIAQFAKTFVSIVESGMDNPEFFPGGALDEISEKESREGRIIIASTFTADPVAEALAFWMDEFQIPATMKIAPYNQIFQQLLDPSSAICTNIGGTNVMLVRLQDWMQRSVSSQRVFDDAQQFVAAVKAVSRRTRAPFVILLCPSSPSFVSAVDCSELVDTIERFVATELATENAVYVVTSSALLNAFPISQYYDEEADALGHIPYSEEFMAVLGSIVARKMHAISCEPCKVIVLDCDNTLWGGVCGEDGPSGVTIDEGRRFLQEFMLAAHDSGVLLCLCSKNNASDVEAAFRLNPGMPLQWHHFLATRIGWEPKSESIRSIAKQFGLHLNSFIFIDDSPVECGEMRAACPEVVTLQLPPQSGAIPVFLKNIWAFDKIKVTAEDRKRPEYYRQELQRLAERAHSASLNDFLDGLELEVSIHPIVPGSESRVAQLTKRTNQFNLNGSRYSESEIAAMSCSPQWVSLSVEAKDRFGDYGLVGAAICETAQNEFRVGGLWVSCRALGRGIESRLLAEIGRAATQRGYGTVSVRYADTSRNQPVRLFLEQIQKEATKQMVKPGAFQFPAVLLERMALRVFDKVEAAPAEILEEVEPSQKNGRWEFFEHIAHRWSDIGAIIKAIQARRATRTTPATEPLRNEIETALSELWEEVLGIAAVSHQTDFFSLGGHSLLAAQLLANINRRFGIELPMDVFFESEFTIADVALIVERALADAASATVGKA